MWTTVFNSMLPVRGFRPARKRSGWSSAPLSSCRLPQAARKVFLQIESPILDQWRLRVSAAQSGTREGLGLDVQGGLNSGGEPALAYGSGFIDHMEPGGWVPSET